MSKRHVITAIIHDKKNRVLSIGQNQYLKSHPIQKKWAELAGKPYAIYLHAEIHAITRCADLSKAYSISVFRYDANGNPALAKPCEICIGAIHAAGIKNIFHT